MENTYKTEHLQCIGEDGNINDKILCLVFGVLENNKEKKWSKMGCS